MAKDGERMEVGYPQVPDPRIIDPDGLVVDRQPNRYHETVLRRVLGLLCLGDS